MLNRNQNSHFASYPTVNMNRSQFDRSHSVKLSFPSSKLIPFDVDEVLPGDTFNLDTSAVCRMATPLFPVMGEAFLDIFYFFVPTRLVWEHTEEFYGANNSTYWEEPIEYFTPVVTQLQANQATPYGGTGDYMGVPPQCNQEFLALPFRAYGLIWNEWFRNENFQEPCLIPTGDIEDVTSVKYYDLLPVNKYRDYFTSCLPSPQKGQPVTIPLGLDAPVLAGDPSTVFNKGSYAVEVWTNNLGNNYNDLVVGVPGGAVNDRSSKLQLIDTGAEGETTNRGVQFTNLYADLTSATAADVNQLRLAFQLQRILERDARYGSRFTEYLKSAYGVSSGDARLQRPEYLGGTRVQINVNQVVQQSKSEGDDRLGTAGAISKTVFKNNSFVHSFVEPGYLIGVCCVRYTHTYQNGLERMWSRRRRFDFYDPALAHIGEQAVLKKEIFCDGSASDNDVFGYQEAFADYRYKPNRVAGDFRSDAPDGSLDAWVYVDSYESHPFLSGEWISEDPEPLTNTLGLTSGDAKQFIADIYIKNIATRVMPVYSIPGLIDHF